ncbi:Gfo/Idh/MocA family protein [Schlesneria sp. DSM 10557]|uniref:Gfo/Idh/MocA family protein n=1 Tax=Schlesneria sp. DSM 10557 TaxID=3044399 RepID=UPI0035A1999B
MTHPSVPIVKCSIATDLSSSELAAQADGRPSWKVGIVGLGAEGLYQLERTRLNSQIETAIVYDPDPRKRQFAAGFGVIAADELSRVTAGGKTDAVFLTDPLGAETASAILESGQHLVLDRPWTLTCEELQSIQMRAESAQLSATYFCPRRWTADVLCAAEAVRSGRLGNVYSVQYLSCTRHLPPLSGSRGVLREFGFDLLDQLRALVAAQPISVFGKMDADPQRGDDCAFLAVMEFQNQCRAEIRIDSRSRLGFRTGWILEGTSGSYRGERLLTETLDGEIVDQPLERPVCHADPFLAELPAAWQGQPCRLPSLRDAASIVAVINAIEQSSRTGEVVRL